MTINKFQGRTEEEAIEKAKQEFGENAVIMNVKEVKPKGVFRAFKNSTYEVTAAMEEKEQFVNPKRALQNTKKLHDSINLSADEKIEIPKPDAKPDFRELMQESTVVQQMPKQEEKKIEQRLDDLSNRLEESLARTPMGEKKSEETSAKEKPASEEFHFVRILYSTLLKNEVHEKYVNQILDEIEKIGGMIDEIRTT